MKNATESAAFEAYTTVLTRMNFELNFDSSVGSGAARIESILNSTVLRGGKRFRPTLLLLFGSLFGLDFETLAPYARAAELAHAATLAHDDVIDNAQERRNSRTLNAVTSNSHAVLGGDFLLARVIAEISNLGQLKIIQEMARVLEALVSGEWIQLDARGVLDRSLLDLEWAAERKTSSLIGWCCSTPARLSGQGDEVIALATEFGLRLGLVFQRIDDVLDFAPGTGKPFAQDFREGIINFVSYELLKQNPKMRTEFEGSFGTGKNVPWPWSQAELNGACAAVRFEAKAEAARASAVLDRIVSELKGRGVVAGARACAGLRETLDAVVNRLI